LLARLASVVDDQRAAPDVSKLSEQQIGVSIAQAVDAQKPGSFTLETRLMYQRTRTGKEIDFVGPDLDGCVEGKYVDQGWKSEALTVRTNAKNGILATRRAQDLTDERVWAVPAPILAWALDQAV